MNKVQTVVGSIFADELGITMAHEHVTFDLSAYYQPEGDGHFEEPATGDEYRTWIHSHPMSVRSNLIQQDIDVATREVGLLYAAGGRTLIDQTTIGLGPRPDALVEISRRTGVQIVAGTGFYISGSYPPEYARMSASDLADHLRHELLVGMNDTRIRAGLIGELGVSAPCLPFEQRLLSGAAQVQQEVGCAVSLHTAWGPEGVDHAVRAAHDAGLDPSRTALCHLDIRLRNDIRAYLNLAREGFFLSLDTFGRDCFYPHMNSALPSDADRMTVVELLAAGAQGRLLFSSDISFNHELTYQGGHGYAHVLSNVVPMLSERGVESSVLHEVLVNNPRTWLAGPE